MKLLVGLGNPGPRYAGTRHNVGFLVAERLAADCGIALAERRFGGRFGRGLLSAGAGADATPLCVLAPETSMNRSGAAVAAAVAELALPDPARDLLIALDDLDLPFGRLRLRPAGGSGGHRGLADVLERLGRRDVPRLRFGVGRPPEDTDPVQYVLEPFSPEQALRLPEAVARAARAAAAALGRGVVAAMNEYNRDGAEREAEPVEG